MTLCRDCAMPVGVAMPKCPRCGGRWPYVRSRRGNLPLPRLLGTVLAVAALVGLWSTVIAQVAP